MAATKHMSRPSPLLSFLLLLVLSHPHVLAVQGSALPEIDAVIATPGGQDYSGVWDLVQAFGLDAELAKLPEFTLLMPTNEALQRANATLEIVLALLPNEQARGDFVVRLLSYHAIASYYSFATLQTPPGSLDVLTIDTVLGQPVFVVGRTALGNPEIPGLNSTLLGNINFKGSGTQRSLIGISNVLAPANPTALFNSSIRDELCFGEDTIQTYTADPAAVEEEVGKLVTSNFASNPSFNTTRDGLVSVGLIRPIATVALNFSGLTVLAPDDSAWTTPLVATTLRLAGAAIGTERTATINRFAINLFLNHVLLGYRTAADWLALTSGAANITLLSAPLFYFPVRKTSYWYPNPADPTNNVTNAAYPDLQAANDTVVSIQGIDGVIFPANKTLLVPASARPIECPVNQTAEQRIAVMNATFAPGAVGAGFSNVWGLINDLGLLPLVGSSEGLTLLLPSNDALEQAATSTGLTLELLPTQEMKTDFLTKLIAYHVVVSGRVTFNEFQGYGPNVTAATTLLDNIPLYFANGTAFSNECACSASWNASVIADLTPSTEKGVSLLGVDVVLFPTTNISALFNATLRDSTCFAEEPITPPVNETEIVTAQIELINKSKLVTDPEFNQTLTFISDTNVLPGLTAAALSVGGGTVLAPTDEAWSQPWTLLTVSLVMNAIGEERNETLSAFIVNVLKYHALAGFKTNAEWLASPTNTSTPTLLGAPVYYAAVNSTSYWYVNVSNPSTIVTNAGYTDLQDPSATVISIQGISGVLIPSNLTLLVPASARLGNCSSTPPPPPGNTASTPPPLPPQSSPPPPPPKPAAKLTAMGSLAAVAMLVAAAALVFV